MRITNKVMQNNAVVNINRNKETQDALNNQLATGKKVITAPCKTMKINDKQFKITLIQGLNRQIRRMCEYYDYRVRSLRRVRIMDIKLGKLKTGEYREFSEKEIEQLRHQLGISSMK